MIKFLKRRREKLAINYSQFDYQRHTNLGDSTLLQPYELPENNGNTLPHALLTQPKGEANIIPRLEFKNADNANYDTQDP